MNFKSFEKKIKPQNVKIFSLGKSTLGKQVWACHVGKEDGTQVLVQAGIHAREYVTSLLAARQAERLQSQKMDFGIYFVLCSNPDGVAVVLDGFSALEDKQRDFCLKRGFDPKLFKANANLVDLNTNFDALWGQGKANVFSPHFENFVGTSPASEVETRLLQKFTLLVKPRLTLSYHTKGEVVYFGFDTQSKASLERDRQIGEKIAKSLGFSLQRSFSSCGGFKDWACDKLDIPSFTLEFGNDKLSHPLGEQLVEMFEKQTQNFFEVIGEVLK